MTLKRLIASKAMELMQLLEHCEDGDFIDAIVNAVASCDYMTLDALEEGQEGKSDENA